MNRKNWVEESLRRSDENQVSGIAGALMNDSREPVRVAVQVWMSPDPVMSGKAMGLLLDLGDLAIVPLIEAQPSTPADKVWAARMAVDAELVLRKKLITRIDEMLDDKTPVPMSNPAPAERAPPPRRICDEGYLLMRSLIHLGEDPIEAQAQESLFLDQGDAEKDAIIQKARLSGVWNRALGREDIGL